MKVVKAAAVQLSPVLYSCDRTVDRVVQKIPGLEEAMAAQMGAQTTTLKTCHVAML